VAWGTPELYDNFPESYFILVEAVPYFERYLKGILKKHRGEYILKGVADRWERKKIFFNNSSGLAMAGTNILEGAKSGALEFDIEIDRLDALIDPECLDVPILLKLDVQGADLRALKGARTLLSACEMVIAEASLFNPNNLVSDIIAYMKQRGFVLYEVLGAAYRPYDDALGQVDLAFARNDSNLIAYKKWA